jgi:hypothetical protein
MTNAKRASKRISTGSLFAPASPSHAAKPVQAKQNTVWNPFSNLTDVQVVQELSRNKKATSADEERRIQAARKSAMQAALALKMEIDSAIREAKEAERMERECIEAEHQRIEEAAQKIVDQREATFRAREQARQNRLTNATHDPFAPVLLRGGGSGRSAAGGANPFAAASAARKKLRRKSSVMDLPFPLPQQEDELAAYDSDEDVHAAHVALAELAREVRITFAPVLYSKDDYDPNDVVEQYARLLRGKMARLENGDADDSKTEDDLFANLRPAESADDEDEVSKIETGMRRLEHQLRLLPDLRERAMDECEEDEGQTAAVEVGGCCRGCAAFVGVPLSWTTFAVAVGSLTQSNVVFPVPRSALRRFAKSTAKSC